MILTKSIIDYIKESERLLNSPNYYGNKIIVKSFLYSLRSFIDVLSGLNSLVISEKNIADITFDSNYYRDLLESLPDKLPIKNKLTKKMFNIKKIERIKNSLNINTFEIQLDYSKAVDLRLGLILIIFNYYLLSYQINNKTIEFCNQISLINLIDTLDKYLSSNTLFPVAIPDKLTKSFTNSIEFKALLIQNRNLLIKGVS